MICSCQIGGNPDKEASLARELNEQLQRIQNHKYQFCYAVYYL